MGYRSEVAAAIHGDSMTLQAVWARFKGRAFSDLNGTPTTLEKEYASALSIASDGEHECLRMYGESWKWYESCADVQMWMEFMHACREAGLNVEFVRVGEETGDIETRYDCPDADGCMLDVVSSVRLNAAGMEFKPLFPQE